MLTQHRFLSLLSACTPQEGHMYRYPWKHLEFEGDGWLRKVVPMLAQPHALGHGHALGCSHVLAGSCVPGCSHTLAQPHTPGSGSTSWHDLVHKAILSGPQGSPWVQKFATTPPQPSFQICGEPCKLPDIALWAGSAPRTGGWAPQPRIREEQKVNDIKSPTAEKRV